MTRLPTEAHQIAREWYENGGSEFDSDRTVISSRLHREKKRDLLGKLVREYADRKFDAIKMYRPLAAAVPFHESRKHVRLVLGSNQAGKTLTVSVEIARIVRGLHPAYRKHGGRILCVGKDENHIGQTMWKKLASEGAFEIVRDEITGMWRAVRPDPLDPRHIDPVDLERRDQWRPAPPLIPPSAIERIAWDDKAANVPRLVQLRGTGWEMLWHSSLAKPRQGIEIDKAWYDEEIDRQDWLPETMARLLRRNGDFLWSFTPQAGTHQAYELHEKIFSHQLEGEEFTLYIDDNPYVTDEAKHKFWEGLTEDERAVRYYSEWAIVGRKVYPEFDHDTHIIKDFTPPDDWMRVMAVDPGTQFAAAVFLAIPPEADAIHVYDTISLRQADAQRFAEEVRSRIRGQQFETFLIDKRGGKQTPMGYTDTIAEHYWKQFKAMNIYARLATDCFMFGTDDVDGRILSIKRRLRPGETTPPTLRFHREATKELVRQIKAQAYSKEAGKADQRDKKIRKDLVDAMEYAVAYFDDGIYYFPPGTPSIPDDPARKTYEKFKEAEKRAKGLGTSKWW